VIGQWADAWNAHDPDQLAALYTPDGVYEEIPTNTVAHGADAVRAFAVANFAAFSDIRVQPQAAFQGDDWAVLQALFAGPCTGQLPGLPAGAGQPFSIPFATIFRMRDGRIEHNTDHFDLYALRIQIGALPHPVAATPVAATPDASTEEQTVQVTLKEMTITASLTTFTVGVPYTFVVTNAGQVEHEMVIEHHGDVDKPMEANGAESEAPDIEPGKAKTLTWTFTEPGTYQLGCHVPGHYEAGMVLPIDVTA
jgi:steroid delta-isomerase-like uncharacterized protein